MIPAAAISRNVAGQVEVGVGVEPRRDGVHLLAPGPERPPPPLRPPPQRPVEGVAVAVREPRDRQAGEAGGLVGIPGQPGIRSPVGVATPDKSGVP